MYGLETIDVALPADMRQSSYATERRFGPKRKMTATMNTSISGVAVLDGGKLLMFHNVHATIPLRPDILGGLPVRQFTLDEKKPLQFQKWVEITV